MGLFQHKQTNGQPGGVPQDDPNAAADQFFDEYFREELRNRGRWHFENIISQNANLFKEDLDATLKEVNVQLKEHVSTQLDANLAEVSSALKEYATQQLDAQVAEYTRSMRASQEAALQVLTSSAKALQDQYEQLRGSLQTSMDTQQTTLKAVVEENSARVAAMKTAQDAALESLAHSTRELEEQHKELLGKLKENVAEQETLLVSMFEQNMARVIEHYVLTALGDQYDLKAQLPAILKQLEDNKQAMKDDMNL